jgi:hypothetical protein
MFHGVFKVSGRCAGCLCRYAGGFPVRRRGQ